jgi:hypothetical protein
MRNIREREREKRIMYGEPQPYWEGSKDEGYEALRTEQDLGEGVNEWELSERPELTSEEQKLSQRNKIAPRSVFHIVAWIIVIVLLAGLVFLVVFQPNLIYPTNGLGAQPKPQYDAVDESSHQSNSLELAQKKVLTKVEDELLFDSFACSKRALVYVLSSSYCGFSLFSWILLREVKQEILEKICQHR